MTHSNPNPRMLNFKKTSRAALKESVSDMLDQKAMPLLMMTILHHVFHGHRNSGENK